MTSKEPIKCIKSFLPDEGCYSCSSCMYYIESDCVGYGEKCYLKQAFNFLNKENPTLSECIKKWEERGYEVNIAMDRNLVIESEKYDLTINICKANLIYEISNYYEDEPAFMTPELHELLTQTLKAMEKIKNE